MNKKIIPVQYPLPNIEDILGTLGKNKIFTALDLSKAYHQITLRPEDRHFTVFTTGKQAFQYRRSPFGLSTSSQAVARAMQRALAGLIGTACISFVDDILVFGKDMKEDNENLKDVLIRLQEVGFKLAIKKCNFSQREINILGHKVSERRISPAQDKILALSRKKTPSNITELFFSWTCFLL